MESFACEECGASVDRESAIRRRTMGELDPDRWQTLCCPACGSRVKTVLIEE